MLLLSSFRSAVDESSFVVDTELQQLVGDAADSSESFFRVFRNLLIYYKVNQLF